MVGKLMVNALAQVRSVLDVLGVPAALMGGAAVAVWGHLRTTHDIDLLIGVDDAGLDRLIDALRAADIRTKREPPILSIGRMRIIQCLVEPRDALMDVQVDLLIADCPYQREALARRTLGQLPDLNEPLDVLTCEDVILHKLIAGRVLDRADAAALLRENRSSLDFEYLAKWVNQLGLTADFEEAWQSALPGTSLPFQP